MTRRIYISFALALVYGMGLAETLPIQNSAWAHEVPEDLKESVDRAVEKVKPALIRIHVVSTSYSGGREIKSESTGSGVIITPEGHAVTNHHVAGHAIRLVCTLANKEEVNAELVGTDPLTDISVIKLETKEGKTYPTAEFGDSDTLKVGQYVLAMGSPRSLSQSVTLGIVSNAEMVMPNYFGSFRLDGEDVGTMVLWVGHDAAIYGGNSGGPLADLEGLIMGINEIKMGLSGAIPGNLAKEIAEELMETGQVSRSWLGIEIQPRLKSYEMDKGILISGVLEDTPASKAGFAAGDMLLQIGGKDIDVRFSEELPLFNGLVADFSPGTQIDAMVLRDGAEVSLSLVPEEREAALPKTREIKEWGITARNLSFLTAREMKRDSTEGILVTSVRAGGPCGEAKPSIHPRDILVAVDGEPVRSVEELLEKTNKILKDTDERVPSLAEFERGGGRYLTVVKVGIQKVLDQGREVRKAWMPLETQVLTRDLAKHLDLEDAEGVRITEVYPHPSIEEVDLQVGDVILGIDGDEVAASEPEHHEVFDTMIRQYKVGATPELSIRRATEELKIRLKLPAAPSQTRELKKYKDEDFEFTVRDIGFLDKAKRRWSMDEEGALVSEIKKGGWAAVGNLRVDDLIKEIQGQKIRTAEDVENQLKVVAKDKPASIVLYVMRGIHSRYLEIEPSWDHADRE